MIWVYLTFAHGRYWRVRSHLLTPEVIDSEKAIVAVVPARNEADVIVRAITGLLNQRLWKPMRIVLVDDNSSDQTAQLARQAAEALGAGTRLQIIGGHPLPSGWTGKMWAVHPGLTTRGVHELRLPFVDGCRHLSRPWKHCVAASHGRERQVRSGVLYGETGNGNTAERLLIPAFVYFFFQLYPPSLIANQQSHVAGAAGGCILIRPQSLAAAGGMEAIKNEIIDDCALARIVKRSGGRVFLALTNGSHSIRSYGSFAGVGRMIARSAFTQLRHSYLLLALTLAGLLLTYVGRRCYCFQERYGLCCSVAQPGY